MTEASTDTIPTGIALALHTDEIPVHEQHHPRRVPVTLDRLPVSAHVGPQFHYPERRMLPPITPPRRLRMIVEPPVWSVSAVIERQHALWERSRGRLGFVQIPRGWEYSTSVVFAAVAFFVLGIVTYHRYLAGIARMMP